MVAYPIIIGNASGKNGWVKKSGDKAEGKDLCLKFSASSFLGLTPKKAYCVDRINGHADQVQNPVRVHNVHAIHK
jgi:hypothetical protein